MVEGGLARRIIAPSNQPEGKQYSVYGEAKKADMTASQIISSLIEGKVTQHPTKQSFSVGVSPCQK